jgi:CRISPR system Cascade subunit CasA
MMRQSAVLAAGQFDQDMIDRYRADFPDRFRLFDPAGRPWMQTPALAFECEKQAGTGKLIVGRTAGNNHAWFSHDQDAAPAPADLTESVASLLTWLYYGPSGKISARKIGGRNHSNAKAGPLRSAMSYFPLAENLFTTLVLSIPYPSADTVPEYDLTPWERDEPIVPDDFADLVRGPRSALTARAQHAVLLEPDASGTRTQGAWISLAHTQTVPPAEDPYTITQLSTQGNVYARKADADRALWRDLDSLLLKEPSDGRQQHRPAVFDSALEALDLSQQPRLRVRALGFDQDGQAKDHQFVAATTPPLQIHEAGADGVNLDSHLGNMRVAAEMYGWRLDTAVRRAWAKFANLDKPKDCAWSRDAAAAFWPQSEQQFWTRYERRDFLGARHAFRTLAAGIYDDITSRCGLSSRGIKAAEDARIWLYGGPVKPRSTPPSPPRATGANDGDFAAEATDTEWLKTERAYINALVSARNDRAARKALRHGLRKPLEDCADMHRYIVPILPDNARGTGSPYQRAAYAVAAMIATPTEAPRRSPDSLGHSGFGAAVARAVERQLLSQDSAERRLTQMTRLGQAGLITRLPYIVRQIAPVMTVDDWSQLLRDLAWWDTDRKTTGTRWLQSFWRQRFQHARAAAEAADDTDNT